MKFGSTFDTKFGLTLQRQYAEKHGVENIILLKRCRSFIRIKVYIPFFVSIFFLMSIFMVFYFTFGNVWSIYIGLLCICMACIIFIVNKFHERLNFKYDFILVSPTEVIQVDQEGLLERHMNKIGAQSIKSIFIKKSGWIDSMFYTGTIIFTVNSDEYNGSIEIDHVENIDRIKKEINRILGL